MADKLLPGNERQPAHPLAVGPRPGKIYRVRNHETWESVARKHGVLVRELIANNCGPDVTPQEINWYLRTRIGCNVTLDHKNWAFSDSANPGVIYIPVPGVMAVPVATQNPKINTLYGGPADKGCGEVEWLVEFELPRKAGRDGWIVQRITRSYDIRNADGTVADPKLNAPKAPFWEAWPVKKGEVKTANRYDPTDDGRTYYDGFDQPRRSNLKVIALVKFFEVDLPATFIKQNPDTRAEDLPSTTVRPDFWDGTGTTHNFTVTWDCTDPKGSVASKMKTEVGEKK